jgi:hypothetical protein
VAPTAVPQPARVVVVAPRAVAHPKKKKEDAVPTNPYR